jgi:hypothetical protein
VLAFRSASPGHFGVGWLLGDPISADRQSQEGAPARERSQSQGLDSRLPVVAGDDSQSPEKKTGKKKENRNETKNLLTCGIDFAFFAKYLSIEASVLARF